MSGVVVPMSPRDIDVADDPAASVLAALTSAKGWLERACVIDLPDIVEAKARAEAVQCYVAQKHLGKEAELAATEIVRRAERRIGELIREGQAAGEITKRGKVPADDKPANGRFSPTDFAADHELSGHGTGIYAMTDDVSADEFEDALAEAKSEENLSRSNVVRKAQGIKERRGTLSRAEQVEKIRELAGKGHTSRQMASTLGLAADRVRRLASEEGIALQADDAIGRQRRIDPNRIVRETVDALDALASAVDLVEFERLERDEVIAWAASMRRSLRILQRFTKELAK